jgi:hypothetical protein
MYIDLNDEEGYQMNVKLCCVIIIALLLIFLCFLSCNEKKEGMASKIIVGEFASDANDDLPLENSNELTAYSMQSAVDFTQNKLPISEVFEFSETEKQSTIDFPLKEVLEAYRGLKSREFAITGQKVTPAIKENWGKHFITFGDDTDKVIYVLHDNYKLFSVEKWVTEVDYTPKAGAVYGDEYRIQIDETIIGTIIENRIEYSKEPSEFRLSYRYYITPDGPKLASEDGFRQYYILEKDVPLLLERLK